jgi:predicted outer membrane repeat protein
MRRVRKFYWLIAGVMSVLLVASVNAQTIVYVDNDAEPGGDGITWDTAYQFLQEALAHAGSMGLVDEIRVAQGTYRPDRDVDNPKGSGDREATFQPLNGVSLLGGYAGLGARDPDVRDTDLYPSILSGDLAGNDQPDFINYDENSYHVVTFSGVGAATTLDGFTITAGNADGYDDDHRGAGILNVAGAPTIADCVIAVNRARHYSSCDWCAEGDGAGLYNGGGSPTVTGCTFIDNDAPVGAINTLAGNSNLIDCTFSGPGKAIVNYAGTLNLIDCTFSGPGTAVVNSAGSSTSVSDCIFNTGGLSISDDSTVAMTDCAVIGNENAGIEIDGSSLTLIRCTFTDNTGALRGSAIRTLAGSELIVAECIFDNNAAEDGGAIYTDASSSLSVSGSTFFRNFALWRGQRPLSTV